MFDSIFTGVLTFSLLAAGTVAIGSEMVPASAHRQPVAQVAVQSHVTLPGVVVTGHRHSARAIAVASI